MLALQFHSNITFILRVPLSRRLIPRCDLSIATWH